MEISLGKHLKIGVMITNITCIMVIPLGFTIVPARDFPITIFDSLIVVSIDRHNLLKLPVPFFGKLRHLLTFANR